MQFQDPKPIYRQIADFILENILSEVLKPGDRVRSVRALAKEIEVNPNTVVRSYNYLNEVGVIENKRGVGYFISSAAASTAKTIKRKEFIENQLPTIYHNMELLGIELTELEELFNDIPEIKYSFILNKL